MRPIMHRRHVQSSALNGRATVHFYWCTALRPSPISTVWDACQENGTVTRRHNLDHKSAGSAWRNYLVLIMQCSRPVLRTLQGAKKVLTGETRNKWFKSKLCCATVASVPCGFVHLRDVRDSGAQNI